MASISTCLITKSDAVISSCYSKPSALSSPLVIHNFLNITSQQICHKPLKFQFDHHDARARGVVIRAAASQIDIPDELLKPGRIADKNKESSGNVMKAAMDAVDACGGRVTVGDVSSKAGISLTNAQSALQALAAETHNSILEVSEQGDLVYVFPNDYRIATSTESLNWFRIAKLVAKVSFGVPLVASNVVATCCCISESLVVIVLLAVHLVTITNKEPGRMHLFEAIFSFVFGDGDPNQGIEQRRWKLIGEHIASNGGMVTAQELAPYLDLDTADKMDHDSSYILPVLAKFDGLAELDEDGNTVYRFPSLQRTACPAQGVGGADQKIDVFMEKRWRLSETSKLERDLVIVFGGANLIAVILLGIKKNTTVAVPKVLISFVSGIIPKLQIYSAFCFLVPLVRWFFIRKLNAQVEKRNRVRKECAQALKSPAPSLRMKLLSARGLSQKVFIGQDQIVYRAGRDEVEQDNDTK